VITFFSVHCQLADNCTLSYGFKGRVIIESTLLRLFGYDTPNTAFAPLNTLQFSAYILVPFIGHKLIAQDLGCDEKAAYKHMIASADVGDGLHPEDDSDEDLQNILDRNMQVVRTERRAREELEEVARMEKEAQDVLVMMLESRNAEPPVSAVRIPIFPIMILTICSNDVAGG
jgi:hypothetical protein